MKQSERLTWQCSECDAIITEPEVPHSDEITGDDVCESCCTYCSSGQRNADQEQYVKEHTTKLNPGDPAMGHGFLTSEQLARG